MDLHRGAKPRNQVHINHAGEYLENPHDMLLENGREIYIHWQGPEYEHYPKEKIWYTVATLILAGIVMYALFTDSPIMAITFVLVGVVSYVQLEKLPRVLDFKVTSDGVMVGNEVYRYNSIKSFWIFYEPPHTKILSLHTDALLTPYVHIPVHQIDPVKLREELLKFIPEVKQEPTMIDTLERLLHI